MNIRHLDLTSQLIGPFIYPTREISRVTLDYTSLFLYTRYFSCTYPERNYPSPSNCKSFQVLDNGLDQ